ncbi:MAG: zinc ribbon domain-containing protein [Deltaproteobacteria bacterium]|nr:zinc ribbon domain-containing protein [Deltaproteobacteria bacterium]
MPIYEYECTKCGRMVEVWQKITDSDLDSCEDCRGKMRKLISQSSFHLKGSGWYVTDYKSKRESEKKKPSSDDKAQSTSGDEKPKKEALPASTKPKDE